MPALPTNADRTNGAATASVAARSWASSGGSTRPVVGGDRGPERLVGAVLAPRLGQRLQLDVGRVAAGGLEVGLDGGQLLGVEGERPRRRRGAASSSASRPRTAIVSTPGTSSVPGCSSGVGDAGRPVLDDRVGDEPAQQHVGVVVGRARRELDAPAGGRRGDRHAELGAGVDDGVGGAVGDAGMERDLDPVAVRARPTMPVCSSGSARNVAEPLALVVVEVALDEDDVGDRDGAVERQPERGRAGGDGLGAGVVVAGSNREPTDRPMT